MIGRIFVNNDTFFFVLFQNMAHSPGTILYFIHLISKKITFNVLLHINIPEP